MDRIFMAWYRLAFLRLSSPIWQLLEPGTVSRTEVRPSGRDDITR